MKAYVIELADGRIYDAEVASVVIAENEESAIALTQKRLSERNLSADELTVKEVELADGLIFVASGHDATGIDVERM